MSPVTHLLTGWVLANVGDLDRRERAAVTLAGIAPDFDGFGAPFESLTRGWENPILWYSTYHHNLGHNLFFGVVITLLCFFIAKQRWKTAGLVFLSFHLHLLGDVAGAKGPDGSQWPIPYFWPFSKEIQLVWSGQWELNAWPNFLITGVLLVSTFTLAWRRGFSPVDIVSKRADGKVVETLRSRFGRPEGKGRTDPSR